MKSIRTRTVMFLTGMLVIALATSCGPTKKEKQVALYHMYCSSCHVLPSVDDLPRDIWAATILPEMGARMGVQDPNYNPVEGYSFDHIDAVNQTGIYPAKPTISKRDWDMLKSYILSEAPDTLLRNKILQPTKELLQFKPNPISLDGGRGTLISYLGYDKGQKKLFNGDASGKLYQYDFVDKKNTFIGRAGSAITSYTHQDSFSYVTAVGFLNPSEIPSGRVLEVNNNTKKTHPVPLILHRPVHTLVHDFNKDGIDELVISEFGNLSGKLSLLTRIDNLRYDKRSLLDQPGFVRTIARDMNHDGLDDIVALAAQGDECIYIFFQDKDLKFSIEKVIRFKPVWGTTWFELIDYDNDGDNDIVTAHGDNADRSYVHKPYHGVRIHINDGENNFEEKYFYPLNGATRLVANDFDQDGDVDFGIIATFPDYERTPENAFVYLENKSQEEFRFTPYTFEDANIGRWLLMDSGDVDNDGDEDIILSSFTYSFTPVPDELLKIWNTNGVDIVLLENILN